MLNIVNHIEYLRQQEKWFTGYGRKI